METRRLEKAYGKVCTGIDSMARILLLCSAGYPSCSAEQLFLGKEERKSRETVRLEWQRK